ncbi:MAG TPA: NADPH:quinone oxidoreductase family protein [Bryobacteraceae bacterium]|jgi:NADPH2:quinone reductase|nr:NADPH:quinone oxidoreductase family protein [Bryobacteraceae bacterium]
MRFEETPIPAPGRGQVRIRVRAAGLNFFDILQIQGKYQVKPPFPFSPGAEAAGVVDECGEGVTEFPPGAAVLAFTSQGAFAEYALAEADRTFALPDGMDFAEAAAFPIVYHTSYFALRRRTQLTAGEWLLVHAGASGVGMSAIQLGRAFGARVIATAGSAEKLAFCRKHGAEEALDYRDAGWVDRVREITGGLGANVIYDPVGGDVFDLSTKCIAPEGRLLVVGFASGRIPSVAANRILLKNISVTGVFWGGHVQQQPGYVSETQSALAGLFRDGKICPAVTARHPLSAAPEALRELAERKVRGKAVLVSTE